MHVRNTEWKVLAASAALLALLSAATFLLLLGQTRSRNLLLLEYQAWKLAGTLTEQYQDNGAVDLDSAGEDVLGFGIYDADGTAAVRAGSAPERLELPLQLSTDSGSGIRGDRFRLVRPMGNLRSLVGSGDEHRPGQGRMMNPGGNRAGRIILIDYGLADFRRQNLFMMLLAVLYAAAVSFLVLIMIRMYRRIQVYRDREQRQERLVQLGEAARTIAHEIRNPLGALSVQRAVLQKRLPDEYHPGLELMGEEIGRISALVERVRDYLKDPGGNPEPVSVSRLIGRIIERLDVPVRLENRLSPETTVRIDPEKLRSVIENLIRNAWESMDGTGHVELLLEDHGREVQIHVMDRGPGIPRELHERIFDPFYTTKESGSGVGLAIARRFVQASGGSLVLADRAGGGTGFTISLPAGEPKGERHA